MDSTRIMDEENYSSDEDVRVENEQHNQAKQNDRARKNIGLRQDDGPRYPVRERQRINRYGNNIYDRLVDQDPDRQDIF